MRRPNTVSPGGGKRPIVLSIARSGVLAELFDDRVADGIPAEKAEVQAKAAFRKLHCVRGGVYVLRDDAEPTWSDGEDEASENLAVLERSRVQRLVVDRTFHRNEAEVGRWVEAQGFTCAAKAENDGFVVELAAGEPGAEPGDGIEVVELTDGVSAWVADRALKGAAAAPPPKRVERAIIPKDASLVPADGDSDAKLAALRAERSGRFGVQVLDGDDAKLKFDADDPESLADFGDPVNLSWPMGDSTAIKASLKSFGADDKGREDYGRRSQKLIWSRLVDRALKDGVKVDKDAPLNALLAPDMATKVKNQGTTTEKASADLVAKTEEMVAKALQRAQLYLAEKLDLEGRTLEDWISLVHGAVSVAAKAGLFGAVSEHGFGVGLHSTGEDEIIVHNWHNGGRGTSVWFKAKWKADKDGKITISDVTEVERKEVWEDVGDGPLPDTAVTASIDGELADMLDTFVKDAVEAAGTHGGGKGKKKPGSHKDVSDALDVLERSLDPVPAAGTTEAALALLERSWGDPGLTDESARGVRTIKGEGGAFVREIPIVKVDAETGEFWAEVYCPLERDTQGDWMTAGEIEKSRLDYMVESQRIDASHDYVERDVSVTSCFQARDGDPDFTPGAWVMGAKAHDPVIEKAVQDGTYNMWSLAGTARAVPDSAPPGEVS